MDCDLMQGKVHGAYYEEVRTRSAISGNVKTESRGVGFFHNSPTCSSATCSTASRTTQTRPTTIVSSSGCTRRSRHSATAADRKPVIQKFAIPSKSAEIVNAVKDVISADVMSSPEGMANRIRSDNYDDNIGGCNGTSYEADNRQKQELKTSHNEKAALSFVKDNSSFVPFTIEKYHLKKTKSNATESLKSSPNWMDDIPCSSINTVRQMAAFQCAAVPKMAAHAGKLELEITALDRELERIQMECRQIGNNSRSEEGNLEIQQNQRIVPRMGTRLSMRGTRESVGQNGTIMNGNGILIKSESTLSASAVDKDASTSAYDTGDSSCNTPLSTPDQSELENRFERIERLTNHDNNESLLENKIFQLQNCVENGSHTDNSKLVTQTARNNDKTNTTTTTKALHEPCNMPVNLGSETTHADHATVSSNHISRLCHVSNMASDEVSTNTQRSADYIDVMYTNQENLEHTIMVQQMLYTQKILQKNRQKQIRSPQSNKGLLNETVAVENDVAKTFNVEDHDISREKDSGIATEWVVRRRPDGSRYIARRPVKKSKQKKCQKTDVRADHQNVLSLSAENETIADVGQKDVHRRNRTEGEKTAESAHVHRHKKEKTIRRRLVVEDSGEGKSSEMVGPLNHRKTSAPRRRKNAFDGYIAVQRVLSHGSRDSVKRHFNPLLSVTTI